MVIRGAMPRLDAVKHVNMDWIADGIRGRIMMEKPFGLEVVVQQVGLPHVQLMLHVQHVIVGLPIE